VVIRHVRSGEVFSVPPDTKAVAVVAVWLDESMVILASGTHVTDVMVSSSGVNHGPQSNV
jgi:hypothetical protein